MDMTDSRQLLLAMVETSEAALALSMAALAPGEDARRERIARARVTLEVVVNRLGGLLNAVPRPVPVPPPALPLAQPEAGS